MTQDDQVKYYSLDEYKDEFGEHIQGVSVDTIFERMMSEYKKKFDGYNVPVKYVEPESFDSHYIDYWASVLVKEKK